MKPVLSEAEKKKNDAWSFIRCQVKAQKLIRKQFASIKSVKVIGTANTIHMEGLVELAEIAGIPYYRNDWEGNRSCGSNWDIAYFDYDGYTFFELVRKDETYDYEPVQPDIQ